MTELSGQLLRRPLSKEQTDALRKAGDLKGTQFGMQRGIDHCFATPWRRGKARESQVPILAPVSPVVSLTSPWSWARP